MAYRYFNHVNALVILVGVSIIASCGIAYDLPALQVIGKAVGVLIIALGAIVKF